MMWDLQKVEDLITNEIEESLHLDYKSADALGKTDSKKNEVSKDVSSFANSDGGVIIYGIKEYKEREKGHFPEKIDPIERTEFSKEWLEQVINGNISPRIKGIKITPIPYGDTASNKAIYVVEIPKSDTAHQAKDKRYYKRFNFESTAMDDYEIKDIINRLNKTDIHIEFDPDTEKAQLTKWLDKKLSITITARILAHNNGNKVAQYLRLFISGNKAAANLIIDPPVKREQHFELTYSNEEERKITIESEDFVIATDRIPILPNTIRQIGKIKFRSDLIFNNMELGILISTEDGSKYSILKGKEILGLQE